jgi:predicted ATP-grasp superfamily ATP-dependent carboligase
MMRSALALGSVSARPRVPRAAWLDFRIRIGGRMGLVRDIPHAGEEIKRDAPVCTLVSARATVPELVKCGARLLSALPDAVMVGG